MADDVVAETTGQMYDERQRPIGIAVEIQIRLRDGGTPSARRVALVAADDAAGISASTLRDLAKDIGGLVDLLAANAERVGEANRVRGLAEMTVDGQTFKFEPGAATFLVDPGGTWVEERRDEHARRRRARLTDADYEQVAAAVKSAQAEGRGIQQAVRDVMQVSQPRAAELIREARRLELLPPATRGRARP